MPTRIVAVFLYKHSVASFNLAPKQANDELVMKKGFFFAVVLNHKSYCFIDATLELLWNGVPLGGLNYDMHDTILVDSYKKYKLKVSTMTGMRSKTMGTFYMFKEFSWGIPSNTNDFDSIPQFADGEPTCCVELLMLFLNNMSLEFKLRIRKFKQNIDSLCQCFTTQDHMYLCDIKNVDVVYLDSSMRDALTKADGYSSEENILILFFCNNSLLYRINSPVHL